jgi:hypothetical protein
MFNWLNSLWQNYGWQVLVVGSLVLIFFFWLFWRRNKKGSYSQSYHYGGGKKKRGIPRQSKKETKCKIILENIFKRPFNKIRPAFLKNKVTGKNLEIDCYCAELHLGLEFNGKQHYEFVPVMHKTKDAFRAQQYRDHMKKEMCEKQGIKLIEVPYWIPEDNLETYIVQELRKFGYQL